MHALNWLVAFAACAALLWFWSQFRSTRGLVITLAGCVVIILATVAIDQPARFMAGAGILLFIGVVAALLAFSSMVVRARRRRPRISRPATHKL